MTWAEQYFGIGVYTLIDYGAHKSMNDEQLVAKVRNGLKSIQLCKLLDRNTEKFADSLLLVTSDQGFSVIPEWW